MPMGLMPPALTLKRANSSLDLRSRSNQLTPSLPARLASPAFLRAANERSRLRWTGWAVTPCRGISPARQAAAGGSASAAVQVVGRPLLPEPPSDLPVSAPALEQQVPAGPVDHRALMAARSVPSASPKWC